MAKNDDKTIYGEPIDEEHVIQTAKKYTAAVENFDLMKKIVQDFLSDEFTGKLSIKEPHKKNKAGQLALLKFAGLKAIYGHLIEKEIDEKTDKDFVTEIFREIIILDMAKMIKRHDGEKIESLEQDIEKLKSRVSLLEKASSSNERLLIKLALEMIDVKKGMKHVKAAVSRLKANLFED